MRRTVRHPRRAAAAAALAALAVLAAPAAPAAAHNSLAAATPAADTRLAEPPSEITVRFLQKLDPGLTTVVLSDATRRVVPTGAPVVAGTRATVAVAETLPDGTYTVAYRVVSTDGHPVQGSYRFTVAGPAATAPAPASAPHTAPPTAAPASGAAGAAGRAGPGGGPGPLTVAAAVALAGVALAAVALGGTRVLRRRRAR
ncbi:copper resistance CopC family protein [Micromonospora carbonacea]|uniref:Copper resistance protein CopC n=1 Tax=Micromonospora carbonacea TaxID=47853 RepID=A0A7H8XKV2_9ACTN|nr:copper resistance CopC family protein [Micromonospora carbonacea]MBB5826863.1 methionine-rich copper-binding protein CopC [Micromonospora carbonacea]QLD25290.1 copper resistance protein CopC [Micromonospora carbonacea]